MPALVKQHAVPGSVKVIRKTDSSTIIELNPTPFGSPSQKDLHGEWFHAETYFGDDVVTAKFGLYEHLLNDQVNPAMAEMGKHAQILGPATLVRKDDAGRWFEIEVQRSLEYHDYLIEMVDKGLMGASTQVFPNGRESVTDRKSTQFGRIDVWIESEVSLTPTPANPKTISLINEAVKSHQMPPLYLVKDGSLVELDEEVVGLIESGEDFSLAAEIDEILHGDGDTEGSEEEEPLLTEEEQTALDNLDDEVKAAFRSIVRQELKAYMDIRIDLFGSDLKEISDYVAQMMSGIEDLTEESQKALRASLDIGKGFKTFVHWMKNMKISEAGEAWAEMSEWERELIQELEGGDSPRKRFPSAVPPGAPGTRD